MPDYLYDVALSFATAERPYVRRVAEGLKRSGYRVFYDEDEQVSLWGEDLIERLDGVYRTQTRYVVIFISEAYARSVWTRVERRSALARAITEREAFVLPARFDHTDLPGLLPTAAYIDIRNVSAENLAELVIAKLEQSNPHHVASSEGWEWLLFADELEAGIRRLEGLRRDHRLGFAPPTGERIGQLDEVPPIIKQLTDEMVIWLENLGCMTTEAQRAAFGRPGEPGDPEMIKHLAGTLTRTYEGVIRWGLRIRGMAVPTEAREVMTALFEYGAPLVDQYEAFVEEYCAQARSMVGQLRAGLPIEDTVILVDLSASIPADVSAAYWRAWKKFKRKLR